ncbi:uncharacterized protein ccdc142 isoform X2 [Brachyhypopomus gauderio]|uniref:uncharacterized protein ccdc142 isoform X2 n=1 Tax=Brachyhypopomus gauderio TaxID=698409 RepID=UPI00404344B7
MTDNSDKKHQDSDDEQRKPEFNPEKCSDEFYWRYKNGGCQYQDSFLKSLKEKEALFWIGSNPSLRLLRQNAESDSMDYAKEDNFVTCQNLPSCSSLHLHLLKETLPSLSTQCHVLRGPGGIPRGPGGVPRGPGGVPRGPGGVPRGISGLSTSTGADFFHQPQAAAFSQHHGVLLNLYEQRTRLLFLHEYSCRCQMVNCFVKRLGNLLEKVCLLLEDRSHASEHTSFTWNLDLRSVCEELQLHVSHWDVLWAKVHSESSLHSILLSHTQVLRSMQRSLWLLGLQALLLTEDCIHTVFSLAIDMLEQKYKGAFEDLLYAMKLYNRSVTYLKSQHIDMDQVFFCCDCSWIGPSLSRPAPFLVPRLMRILAQRRAQIASAQFYNWTSQQIDLLSLAGQPDKQWGSLEYSDFPFEHPEFTPDLAIAENLLEAVPDKPCKKPLHSFWSPHLPFPTFVHGDGEYLEIVFQMLVSSTDILVPHVPKLHPLDRIICAMKRRHKASMDEERLLKTPRMVSSRHKAKLSDLSKSDTYMELFSQYRDIQWREFGCSAVGYFYYQSHNSVLGGVSQWNYHMMFLLVKCLKHTCKEKRFPEECKDVLNKLSSHILSTAAFMHWDEMMCASLGLGLTDKCLPITNPESSTTTTTTTELLLRHFAPLVSVVQLLHPPGPNPPGPNSGEKRTRSLNLYHVGLLCRSTATVQSAMLWVMTKGYNFLAAWSLAKFLLVIQGDLKILRGTAQNLAEQLECVTGGCAHALLIQHRHQLTWAVLQLQVFSDLALKIFSIDVKKMSVEIFEQTMPTAKHWRVNKQELPSRPSEYAASAAQTVIVQVLEALRCLPGEDGCPALVTAVTAFMEAWMEHIIKQKIKFSVQGALQLKQDFDLIRDLIRSEYSLRQDLPLSLLPLRVFYQVDSAIVCLLQQPVAQPYTPLRGWHLFRSCCEMHLVELEPRWWTRLLAASITWKLWTYKQHATRPCRR